MHLNKTKIDRQGLWCMFRHRSKFPVGRAGGTRECQLPAGETGNRMTPEKGSIRQNEG